MREQFPWLRHLKLAGLLAFFIVCYIVGGWYDAR